MCANVVGKEGESVKDKGHFIISILKSAVRILACVVLLVDTSKILFFSSMFLFAELFGIAEELADKR